MKWKTAISRHKNGDIYVYGEKLVDLVGKVSFSEAAFLLLKGGLPNKMEREMFDAILVACVEHSIAAPSTFVARSAVSVGNPVNAALAAGILATGDWHGGAIEQCARLFQQGKDAKTIVAGLKERGERMPGYGHKVYKDSDPRTEAIFAKAEAIGFGQSAIELAKDIQKELKAQTGKALPINIDGAIAAVITEFGFDWRLGKALFVLGRLPGMMAHVREEQVSEKPYRRLDDEDIEYSGL